MHAASGTTEARHKIWLGFIAVAVVHFAGTLHLIDLPGVYMDAVNPDYMVVKILNPHHASIVAWLIRDNYIADRFPVLVQMYHGSLTFWFGLPLYWLFGTTVEGLRLTHATFALAVLASLYAVLIRSKLTSWQAALACIALAVDPAFSFAFRSSTFIIVSNDALILLSLFLLLPLDAASVKHSAALRLAASGFFAGLAVFGYFVFAFYVPVLLVAAAAIHSTDTIVTKVQAALQWLAGAMLGASGYMLGYGLILREVGSVGELWRFLMQLQGELGAFSSSISIADRLEYAFSRVILIISNTSLHSQMFWDLRPVPGSAAKELLVLGFPFVLWLLSERTGTASASQRTLLALPTMFFAASLLFGDRLNWHHFSSIVPFLYGALAIGLHRTGAAYRIWSRRQQPLLIVTLAILCALNISGQVHTRTLLAKSGGRGLMSDAINRFAADLNAAPSKPHLFLPDWGLLFPVQFLTAGSVPTHANEHFSLARALLCEGKEVTVALMEGERSKRFAAWRANLGGWPSYSTVAYRDRTGSVVFEAMTFHGDRNAPGCPRSP